MVGVCASSMYQALSPPLGMRIEIYRHLSELQTNISVEKLSHYAFRKAHEHSILLATLIDTTRCKPCALCSFHVH
jgi:hypothetical protein